ncbi:hypothetical protein UFOVP1300_27 [uncultured Caudovirales phage]|uniref:Uncharacterized protein n=1 Tax=uncultured Caudovirales phage TaxID=2100421 RepID=A0A6J5QAB0_9CAUD|nr:hypothetical protein UFOVP1068_22 [uncultured Caudovirales phage]CAB4195653.1 hypothetical protein UFOVP1300_27 [uncultured Caudovirales phage]
MNTMTEILAVVVLLFLFQGEPDVWDKLHAKAMSMETCK